ncbi:MAG TPA: DJ-1 family glyoxalase III [Gammaproteobacteria bacterium]|jgi:4-methyl-5(b-hydroxyethyl)-thiazole monophosphate biosynthesis
MAKVLVPLAEGCEELEAVTVIDLLRRANITVVTAGLEAGPVTASRGVVLMADKTLDEALQDDYEMVVLPGGGPGSDRLDADDRIRQLLIRMANSEKFTAAICAAPKVLKSAGLLDGKQATCYPGVIQAGDLPGLDTGQRVVQDGKVVTSRGPGTAMDFALQLIEILTDKNTRDQVEAGLVR